ncbi:MAG: hypothetical protein HY928_12190 [Elusimicrobia bacterium]|nr:hypothetical protein [Elusimicrobiota bacterium]
MLWTPAWTAAEVDLLVEARPGLSTAGLGLGGADGVRLRAFDAGELSDPIVSGRLSARLQASDGVVAVGYETASWVARELEGGRVHFVGGVSRLSGAALKARGWSGELSFPAGAFLDLARREGWRRVGVLLAAGYEGAEAALRAAAAARGLSVEVRTVSSRRDIPKAAQDLAGRCSALWVLGDPLLTRGAGFDYLVELSLSRRLPLLAPEPGMVDGGAFAAWEPDQEEAAARGAALSKGLSGEGWPASGVRFGSVAGRLRVNEVLRRRWAGGGG